MPYYRKATGIRSLPRRGMGQPSCNWLQNFLCGSSNIESVMGTPCSECNPIAAPSVGPGASAPTTPVGYNAITGTIDPSSGNVTGETGVNPFNPILPDNPGGNTGGPPAVACPFALFGETSCWGPIGVPTAVLLGGGLLFFLLVGIKR
jgi:hypothetical protein